MANKTDKKKIDKQMVPIYGNLIVKGQKNIIDVPINIREDVYQWLINNGYSKLIDKDL